MHQSGFSIARRGHKVASNETQQPPTFWSNIMKTSIAFGFALSVLASSAVFASPEHVQQPALVNATSASVLDLKVADKDSVKPFDSKSSTTVIVAENRKEFGSQYQRDR
jgi:hypothetical protein